jgi:hypothetical protein
VWVATCTLLCISCCVKDSAWPHFAIIETFWCSCLVASIGYAHGVQFVTALDFLMDLFSVYQRDDRRIKDFFVRQIPCGDLKGWRSGPDSAIRPTESTDYREDHLRKLEIFVPADSGSLFASQQKDITRRFSGRLRCGFSRLVIRLPMNGRDLSSALCSTARNRGIDWCRSSWALP